MEGWEELLEVEKEYNQLEPNKKFKKDIEN